MRILRVLLLTALCLSIITVASATEEYAKKTRKSCEHCHLDATGGGELTKAGEEYFVKIKEESDLAETGKIQPSRKRLSYYIRLVAGFLHVFMGIFWFGTILYIKIIRKPTYAAHGLPKDEVRLGLFSMLIMAMTGSILVMNRISSFSTLLETRFGILLLVKIATFLIMVAMALGTIVFISPKLRAGAHPSRRNTSREITTDDLRGFSGEQGAHAYFAYQGNVYDSFPSEFWKNGTHFSRHKAGKDLTAMLEQAPHGEEQIFKLPLIGKLIQSEHKKKMPHEKIFFFIAYTELAFVILIILILALWKWG